MRKAQNEEANAMLRDHDVFMADVQECLHQAQQHAKTYYDSHHRTLEFEVGVWVWLCLLLHKLT